MKKILVIDDDRTFQKVISDKLKLLHYDVVSAFDGVEGLSMVQKEKPDLMLLDIRMPHIDGITLLKTIRENPEIPKMPVFITSNLTTTDNIADGAALGIRAYIIKSDETLEMIVSEVQSAIGKSE